MKNLNKCDSCGKFKGDQKNCLCNIDEDKKQEAIKYLQTAGYQVQKREVKTDQHFIVDPSRFKGDTIKFAAIGDTHIGSKYQQMGWLTSFYCYCFEKDINLILHAGDVVAGNDKVYKGQEYELFIHGADAQLEYIVENYPRFEGIETKVIAGNHDESFWKDGGYNLVKRFAEKRPDIEYLGLYGAYLDLKGIKVYLAHGDGGNAYARSYKMQKRIEQFSPQEKPDVYILGHYHTVSEIPMYRNVLGIQVGCFEAQTPYLKRKGLYPEIGGHIIELKVNSTDRGEPGIISIKREFIPFYVPVKNDY